MAVRSDALIGHLERTASILPAAANMSVCLWVRAYGVTPAPGSYRVFYAQIDAPGTYAQYAGLYSELGTNDVAVSGDNGGGFQATAYHATTLGTWYHLAWTQTGTTQRFYANGALIGSCTLNRAAVTVGFEYLLNDTFSTGDVDVAYCRQWTTALTADQILTEMQSTTAVLNTDLYMDCPLEADALDISGFGHDWTTVGSVSYVAQPTFPSNSSIATATAFGTLPQTITQDFGDGVYAWYSYTGHAEEVIAGFFAAAAIPTDSMVTTVYESDGTTAFLDIAGTNVPLQVPQSSGTLLYFKVAKAGSPPSTDVTFSGVPGPTSTVPAGAIFTNDDVVGFRMMAISATDGDYSPLRYFDMPATNSEGGGDVLADGSFLLANDEDLTLGRYSSQLALQSTVSGITTQQETLVRTCLTPQVYYVGNQSETLHAVIRRVSAVGVVTDTWILPTFGLTGLAATNSEATIYVTGQTTALASPVKQWNPGTSTFGADLVAGVANYSTGQILVMSDDTLIVTYGRPATTDVFIRQYDAAGLTLNTYQPWGANNVLLAAANESSIFHATDDPVSFWVRLHNVTGVDIHASVYYQIRVSDGVVLNRRIQGDYESGAFIGTATLTPTSRFGIATSCPSFILREAIAAPIPDSGITATEYLIRRERIFPVISKEQHRLFFSKLQLYFEAGVGLSSGQGSDPIVELDWSDDGGHTWSNLHLIQTGKQGQYKWRAMKWNMGSARERLYRVAVTDPVQWTLIDAFLEFTEGLS